LESENLPENYPSCIYICLDEGKLYMEPDSGIILPHFDNMEKSLMKHYAKLNENFDYQIIRIGNKPQAKFPVRRTKDMRNSPSLEERESCLNILEIFKETLQKKILKYIPPEPIYKEKNVNISFK